MADINRELEELAELTQKINAEMRMYGQLTADTQRKKIDAEIKATYGLNNFSEAADKGGHALVDLAKSARAAGSAALEGSKKASSMNGALDQLTEAAKFAAAGLGLLLPGGPIIKGIGVAFGLLAGAALDAANKYREVAVKISDQLYEGYSALAQSGAAASDGMTGLFEDAKKLGYSLGELAQYTQLIGENSKDLALFGGTVFEGRRQFADMGKSFEKYSGDLIAAGFTQTQINEGMMGYIKLQTRAGQSQTKTADQLSEGARKYLLEMDGLAKITGQTRKEMEAQRERQLLNEQFAAKIRELQLRGGPEAEAAAERLKGLGNMAARMGPEMEEAFLASVTGNFANAKAIGANIASQNELIKTIGMVEKGLLTPAEAMQRTAKAMGKFGDSMTGLAQVNAFESAFGIKYATVQQARLLAEGDIVENLKKAEDERKKQGAEGGKAADNAVAAQVAFQTAMRNANEQVERFFIPGMAAATNAAALFATSTEGVAARMNKLFGITPSNTTPGPGPDLDRAKVELDATKKELDASTERARLAAERAAAAEKDANMSRAEKDRIKKEARDSEAQVAQDIRLQREAQLREQNARRAARRAGSATPTSAAPTTSGSAGGAMLTPPGVQATPVGSNLPTSATAQLKDYIKATESFTPTAFWDYKQWTNGYGTKAKFPTGGPNDPGPRETVTKEEAESRFSQFVNNAAQMVGSFGKSKAYKWGQNQVDALTSFIFNGGPAWLKQVTADGKRSNAEIADAMLMYNKADGKELKGLTARRQYESQLFRQDMQAADGGMFTGPKSGYPAILHGTEAVIPLKNGAVPVSLSLKEMLGGPTLAGYNEYAGYNMGPMSTDLDAVKKIASAAGAFDRATETITNPEMWKQVLSSGLATNYQIGNATIGTRGIEGLGDDIAQRLKEIQEQSGTDTNTALQQVTTEFKAAMTQLSQRLSENAGTQNQNSMSGIASLLEDLISATKSGVSVQQKILASSY